jgi:hypothetical protein
MSYLAWPVAINGRITNLQGEPLHITCKYWADQVVSLPSIAKRLELIDTSPISARDKPHPHWEAVMFGDLIHVLELTNPPERMVAAHHAFDDVYKDDFSPWRPHITLDVDFWRFVKSRPGHVLIEMGPLMVMGLTK